MINKLMKKVSQSKMVPPSKPWRNSSATGEPVSLRSCTTSLGKASDATSMRRTMRSPLRPFKISQRSDSGNIRNKHGANSKGNKPPATSTPRQPTDPSKGAAIRPPRAEPIVKPQNISVTRPERRGVGQYSEVSVIALGMAPPRPSPVKKRSTSNMFKSVENAESKLASPKKTTENSRIGLRP